MIAALRVPPQPPPAMLCAMPSPSYTALIDEALRITKAESDDKRKSLVENTIISWNSAERQRFSDEMSDALSARAASIQMEALQAHERGEDVTEASEALQTLVDMTFQLKLLVRKLQQAEAS